VISKTIARSKKKTAKMRRGGCELVGGEKRYCGVVVDIVYVVST
jgi:hypothetical protein